MKAHEIAQRVLDELREHPDGLRMAEIAQNTGLNLGAAADGAARLIRDHVCEVYVPEGELRRVYRLRANADDYTPQPRGSYES